ncbi:hypothetical protein AS850_02930 [Frondihabitans sp. 762G35]|uniref:hypothetical protein n=1 Tax=Frondihabitans sp. 762G35 TaxID=1446794 RepID=UPI000D21A277|nr:hypothetical protein [Frondihabitans sp. 762G35]ARC56027.1 hypothetical protein AS850_02930 [Frondihabitans sp. 762G35]
MTKTANSYAIHEFKSRRFIEYTHSRPAAEARCVDLYLRSGRRTSFYFRHITQ